jgi:hypothetical protein
MSLDWHLGHLFVFFIEAKLHTAGWFVYEAENAPCSAATAPKPANRMPSTIAANTHQTKTCTATLTVLEKIFTAFSCFKWDRISLNRRDQPFHRQAYSRR